MFLRNKNTVACDVSVLQELKHHLVKLKLSVFDLALWILPEQIMLMIILPEQLVLGTPILLTWLESSNDYADWTIWNWSKWCPCSNVSLKTFCRGYAGCFLLFFSRGGLNSAGQRHRLKQVLQKIFERVSYVLPLILVSFLWREIFN